MKRKALIVYDKEKQLCICSHCNAKVYDTQISNYCWNCGYKLRENIIKNK